MSPRNWLESFEHAHGYQERTARDSRSTWFDCLLMTTMLDR